ncbi:MAG: preprotein translocase subunit SecG [Paludibacteraceae bacterium]|nr:preprotein translocase subunit SecG [Paludibacteraceae bacterium]MBR6042847.1 preprotein translocase subunit SecG [Paludibacteraceae bacterium]
MYYILTGLIVFASILMVAIVLVQKSKGGGLAENFAKGNDFAGVKQTTDIVEKITWFLMGFIVVLSIITSITGASEATESVQKSEVQSTSTALPVNPGVEGANAQPAAPAAPAETPAQ